MKRIFFNYIGMPIFAIFMIFAIASSGFYLFESKRTSDFTSGMQEATLCQNGNDIVLNGDLSHKLQEEWVALLKSLNDKKQVRLFLNSRGGNNDVAQSISADVKKLGITTVLPANSRCYSACPLIFVGSEKRIADPTAELGFHSPSVRVGNFSVRAFWENRVEYAMKRFPESSRRLAAIRAFEFDEMKTQFAKIMQSYDSDFAVIQQTGPIPACVK